MTHRHLIPLFAVLMFLTACSSISRRLPAQPEAPGEGEILLGSVEGQNAGLHAFKGIGKATIEDGGKIQTARVAWAGADPDRLRIEILGPAGQPLAGFAYDGQWVTMVSHSPVKFIKKRTASANLNRLLGVPVNTGDMVALMAGRVPVREHRSVQIARSGDAASAVGDRVLVLKQAWGRVVEKIFLDRESGTVNRVEIYRSDGELSFRATFIAMAQNKGFRVPTKLKLSDEEGRALDLDIQRYWPETGLESSVFALTDPASADAAE